MNLITLKSKAKLLLANNKVERALGLLIDRIENDAEKCEELVVLRARLSHTKTKLEAGLINNDTFYVEVNRIISACLELVDRMDENDLIEADAIISNPTSISDYESLISYYKRHTKNLEKIILELQKDRIELVSKLDKHVIRTEREQNKVPNEVESLKYKCREHVAKDELETVFELLKEFFLERDERQFNYMLILQNRWNANHRNKILGQLTSEKYNLEKAKIINGLLIAISDIDA